MRHGEALLDGGTDLLAALPGGERLVPGNLPRLINQLSALDDFAEPLREVALVQVKVPGLVIHAIADLYEKNEVLRLQIQLALRPADVETVETDVLAQVALGVLAAMAQPLRPAGDAVQSHRRLPLAPQPHHHLPLTRRGTRLDNVSPNAVLNI